jgi:hypothetical protein
MIVLDEQLLGRNLEAAIAQWYRGAVQFIIDLRPNTVIKDDAISHILGEYNQPTFVTINERDFWRRVEINRRFCVVCFTLSDARVKEISGRLRILLNQPGFKTKASRMGKVVRITEDEMLYYTFNDRQVRIAKEG